VAPRPAAQHHGAAPAGAAASIPGEEQLVRRALPTLHQEARRLYRRLGGLLELEELIGLGHGAIVGIVRAYDPQRATFEAYVTLKLRWAMLDGIRRATHGRARVGRARALATGERLGRAAQAKALTEAPPSSSPATPQEGLRRMLARHAGTLAVSLIASTLDVDAVARRSNPEQAVMQAAAAKELREAVAELPDRQRELVERHYFADERFDHIAADLGISKSRASRLHAQAIAALACRLREPSVPSG